MEKSAVLTLRPNPASFPVLVLPLAQPSLNQRDLLTQLKSSMMATARPLAQLRQRHADTTSTASAGRTHRELTEECSEFSQRSCEECLKNVSCLWCYTNNTCIDYPVRSILPPSSLCSLSNAQWGVCWINVEALIIAIAVVAGLILVSIAICCCYCCYCRRRSRSRSDEEEERLARKREERRLQSLQRKHERKLKHDEIRKKYGLLQDSDNPYSRFENE
ncbi:PREDICTED: pituitary tumor-transforming gene 1 protein-interacting protein [Aptenodytes forsteri]|uniref:pituitary tumor-transforming gene 1 protein-interacting protein n=1 Tax=Aptenodytes forsteri TaxID=9233 RepID=UPI000905AD8C|nr:PREDICTED: pituitary tumor-transforming gene 1 protein-interacting protein [Aptenodytes forsteri]